MIWAILSTIALQLLVVYVPFLQVIFDTVALDIQHLVIPVLAGVAVIIVVEFWKWILRLRK
jgi:Ca2+-transporting ATPase